ncbi:MAG TPA: hypothetical protein VKA67_04445, partial [Verrucomicrobiae bacterium]|nr:hypothetical protein [Verrucomicrobiae bacterium]
LGELDIVKNEKGQTNVVSLMAKSGGQGEESATEMLQRTGLKFTGIDELNLTLGKARFVDLKDKSRDQEFQLGLKNLVLKNVKSEQDLYLKLFVAMLTNGTSGGSTPQSILNSYLQGKTFGPENFLKDFLTAPAKH